MTIRIRSAVLAGASALILQACTASGLYEGMRQSRLNECNRFADNRREECLERMPPDYQTYKREREEAMER